MKKLFVYVFIIMFSSSYASCPINDSGIVTGAACTIPKTEQNTEKKTVQEVKQKEFVSQKNIKFKEKKKRINFKLDRSLLYRNVTIIWFN